jgi:hypothetical protein
MRTIHGVLKFSASLMMGVARIEVLLQQAEEMPKAFVPEIPLLLLLLCCCCCCSATDHCPTLSWGR